MPDESCRHCGGSLADFSQCAECKKVISMICKSCRTKTIEQYHSECILALSNSKSLSEKLMEPMPSTVLA